jgi:hypothetical protein
VCLESCEGVVVGRSLQVVEGQVKVDVPLLLARCALSHANSSSANLPAHGTHTNTCNFSRFCVCTTDNDTSTATMAPKKARPSIADPALDEAVAQLSALSFAPTDLTAIEKYRGYIVPGIAVRGTPAEERVRKAEQIEAPDSEEELDEEDAEPEDAEPKTGEWSVVLTLDEPKELGQNYIDLGGGDFIHVGIYLGNEWEEEIVSIVPRATRLLC